MMIKELRCRIFPLLGPILLISATIFLILLIWGRYPAWVLISCRVSQMQNVTQLAPLEAGNSPQIIFSNHRKLVQPADAVKWFAIEPETPANVIPALPPVVAAAA